jgi:hypothetical protein
MSLLPELSFLRWFGFKHFAPMALASFQQLATNHDAAGNFHDFGADCSIAPGGAARLAPLNE